MVLYQGSSYVAKQSVIGQLPTNSQYWDCIATGTLKQFTYDSVAEMKLDNSLEDGMYAFTGGYYEANDGGDSTYKITSTKSQTEYQEELDNELYTTLIVDNGALKNRTAIPTSTILRISTLYYVDVNII